MQNRSELFGLDFFEHILDEDFPMLIVADFIKSDEPIRSLHFHNCSEIGFCQHGSGVMIVGEKVMTYHAGDITFIAEGEPHFSRSAEGTNSQWTWLMFDPLRLLPGVATAICDPWRYSGREFHNIFTPQDNEFLQTTIKRVIQECGSKREHWKSAVRSLIWDAMIAVNRSARTAAEPRAPKPLNRIAPALEALAKDYGDRWTVGKLADTCCMSESNFRRVWKDAIGQSPQEYIISMRMQMAAALLRSPGRSVLEVSLSVGFDSLSSFNRLFRRYFDCTPLQWRKLRPD
ncbi:hypothetical protein BB934_38200 (plasmid) [Microvirga ossetica]|uniref:HTH araC/xylS-type domain-containing protein n=1 Tax=Microvirga ossetica TaxID=1882682 RepID=A0A1B2EVV7_9HYPH|nr:AraC family transcriptional regulator [Microvirga ossetica]ANY84092.1 hypothetical protein BB934_38200 [Microvirga ossetica]